MYFKIAKKEFLDKLSIVSRAISVNSPLPSLQGIKLNVKEDRLLLTASDMDISIQITIERNETNELVIEETGDIILDSKYIVDMIRKIDAEVVEVETVDGLLIKISGEVVNFELNGINSDNYPLLDFSKPEERFTVNADTLKEIVSQTCFATSDKEARPVLTGVNMHYENNKLTCVATDTYRLSQKIIYMDEEHNFNITVPAKTLNEVAKIIGGDKQVEIAVSDKKILFDIENIIIQTRLIDSAYPDTARLIQPHFDYELVVDARSILNAIDRASFIKNDDGVSIIRMEINEDEVIVTSKAAEVESVEKLVPVSYTGNKLNISFKGSYVYEAVRALNTFQIKMCFNGEMKPFILTSIDRDDVLELVSPIRTFA